MPEKKKLKIKRDQEGKGGSNEFKTTALTFNQPHSLMFSVSLLFVDFRLFQTLSKDSPRKEHFPSGSRFSYNSPHLPLLLVFCRVRAHLPGQGQKPFLFTPVWWLPSWCPLEGSLKNLSGRGPVADRRSIRCDGALGISFASSREALIQPPAPWTRANPTQRHSIL